MLLTNLRGDHPGVILEDCVTAEAAADLTGYNIQHIRRLAYAGKLEAIHVGRSWLIKIESIEAYLSEATTEDDGRYGPRAPARSQTHVDASDAGKSHSGIVRYEKGVEPFQTSTRNE